MVMVVEVEVVMVDNNSPIVLPLYSFFFMCFKYTFFSEEEEEEEKEEEAE